MSNHAPTSLHGFAVDASDPDGLRQALQLAFDYRGDVTIVRQSPSAEAQAIEGYVFDCRTDQRTGEMIIRVIPKDSDDRIVIRLSEIESLRFTGRDTASGKTFENWIKKYVQKKLAGEAASIESESLEDT